MENQNPVHVFATWQVKEGQIENVLQLLKTVQEESTKEEGNLFYTLHQSTTDLNALVLFEGYTSEDAITAHRDSPHFQDIVIGQIVPLLEKRDIVVARAVTY